MSQDLDQQTRRKALDFCRRMWQRYSGFIRKLAAFIIFIWIMVILSLPQFLRDQGWPALKAAVDFGCAAPQHYPVASKLALALVLFFLLIPDSLKALINFAHRLLRLLPNNKKLLVKCLVACSFLLFFLGALVIVWKVPEWQVAQSGVTSEEKILTQTNELRRTWAQIAAGALALIGLYIAWVRSKAMRDQADVDRDRQFTDLYVKAIEQLGSDKLQIRLGGIYALERIARESPKDHWPIMEVLTAFVRENAPRQWDNISGPQPGEDDVPPPPPTKPSTDIQAVLTVIGRRSRTFGQGEDQSLDLRETQLAGADLENFKLRWALLEEADLQRANLQYADLQRASLRRAKLKETLLEFADLQRANLNEANMKKARLLYSNLQGANLEEADLQGANFWKANLNSAFLEGAELKGAVLKGANLRGADLQFARGLTTKQVAQAIWDETTKWPEDFSPPKPRKEEE